MGSRGGGGGFLQKMFGSGCSADSTTSFLLKRNGSSGLWVLKSVRERDKNSVKLKVVEVCNIRVRNHQTFQNSCLESSKVCVRNHQDNYFLINITYRSDANLINGHGSIFGR